MRDYGKVFSRIWESADFRSLSEDGRTLVMYLLTCQHGTIAGVFRVPDGYATEDLQWTVERVLAAFAELHRKGFANRCETTKWVWVVKFLEWNPPENPNQRKSAVKIVASVPDACAWKPDFMRVCGPMLGINPVPEGNPSQTLGEGSLNQKQEQKQEQEQKQNTSGEGGDAAGPSAEQVAQLTKDELWRAGKSLLHAEGRGLPMAQCGSFVGKLVKDYGDRIVVDAVRAAVVARPADPAEYLKATCMRAAGQRAPAAGVNRQEALEQRNRQVAHEWAQQGATHAAG